VIIRYNSDGTLDMTFSGDGILTFRFIEGGSSYVNDIAQQPDGKIVASVDTTYTLAGTEDFSMIRLNTDGAFDASFDGNGIVQSQWSEDGQDRAFQSDGKIVAVGWQTRPNVTERGVCTQRFNSDGTVDYSVNPTAPNGRIVQKFKSVNAIEGLPNGKILVAGYESLLDVNGNFLRDAARLIRLNSDGTLDSTFMDEGAYEYVNSSGSSYFNDLKILGDGSFLVAGETGNAGGIITKFTPAGILDTTFSGDGVYTGNIITRIYGLAVQTDGKVIGCGSNGSFLAPRSGKIVRLSATGTFEQDTFSSFGNANSNEVFDCGLQSDGKLIVSGFGNNGTSDFIGTSRKLSTLAPDTAFGTNGIVTTDMSATLNDRATDMVIQPDDKIVVSSQGFNINGDRDYAVIRYNSNGTLDNSFVDLFGTNGISLINFGATNPNDEANAILLQPDGQLIAGGVSDTGTVKLFSLAKLNGDGSPALGFGILGRTGTQFPNNDSQVNALGFQFDGKILAGGRTWNGTAYDFAIARFQNEAPTAASVSVGGRVLTAQGSGIRNAVITLTGGSLTQPITTRTSSFGYYRFDEIPAGATYILTVGSKRFSFTNPSMIISLSDEINEANFVAEQ